MIDTKTPIVRSSSNIHPFRTEVGAFFAGCNRLAMVLGHCIVRTACAGDLVPTTDKPIALPLAHVRKVIIPGVYSTGFIVCQDQTLHDCVCGR